MWLRRPSILKRSVRRVLVGRDATSITGKVIEAKKHPITTCFTQAFVYGASFFP
ncbi:hypothetical protein [Pyrofollis japonicus]|uniref:hypothetical protein n=1 Tax=Pyrofollis japonicus TaxID=3060460 RepID=UPI00295B139C|nr:hypothetical protein [Pyrofollis japonicus]